MFPRTGTGNIKVLLENCVGVECHRNRASVASKPAVVSRIDGLRAIFSWSLKTSYFNEDKNKPSNSSKVFTAHN